MRPSARLNCETLEDRLTPAVAYALSGTDLLAFDTANPGTTTPIAIVGVTGGETLVGIDFRPQNGLLYGLGVNASAGSDNATLYTISTRTGVASVVGTASSVVFTTDGTTRVDLPDPTIGYGFDFNPAADRIRVVAGALNFRINPNTGLGIDGDNTGLTTGGTPTGTNPDGPINTGTTSVDAAAYTNNEPNNEAAAAVTTLYTLDAGTNTLFIQGQAGAMPLNPNTGTQTGGQVVMLGGAPLDFTVINGFDIPAGVNAPGNSAPVTAGSAFAILQVGTTNPTTGLYSINLASGQATFLGNIGNGATAVRGLAVQSDVGALPAIGITGATVGIASLIRFDTAAPDVTSTPVNVTTPGETLVGIAFRPQTGQLYGLGVNAATGNGTLYLIDPQTGTVTVVGATGGITLAMTGTLPATALPNPATAGYGFDFNPTVDAIRVVTSTGQSFTISVTAPTAGTVVARARPLINGATTALDAVAYTNSFGQGVGVGNPTTLYSLDSASNSLFIQNAGSSATTAVAQITLDGAVLDFSAVNGFEIPAGVTSAGPSGTPAAGFGYAVLTVGAGTPVTSLYRINLATGAATLVDTVGAGATGLTGFTLGDAPGGVISFQGPDVTGNEGGVASVVLTRNSGRGPQTVTVSVISGTTAGAADFTGGPYTVTFGDGDTTATLNIPLTADMLTEGPETLVLAITAAPGAVLGAQTVRVVTINDTSLTPINPGLVSVGPNVTFTRAGDSASTTIAPFPGFSGTVSVGTGDVNDDGIDDVIVGASVSGHVKVFDGQTGAEIRSFFPFVGYTGGTYVAGGDISGDGIDDIIIGATINGHVKVFDGASGAEIRSFFAYVNFAGEVRVGSGDIDGDGRDDIITGAGSGAFGHVKVFSGRDNSETRSFLAYVNFNGGIFVAGGDVNGDGRDDIVTGAEANGHVKVFSGTDNSELRSFFAFPGFVGASRVAARTVNSDGAADLIVGTGPGGNGLVRTFDGLTLDPLAEMTVPDPQNRGVFVG